jgi:hypothetical protein
MEGQTIARTAPPHAHKKNHQSTVERNYTCVISGFRRGVIKIFPLLGYYAATIGSYRRFGTTSRSHPHGSSSRRSLTLVDGSDRLSRNGGNYQSTLRHITDERRSHNYIILTLYEVASYPHTAAYSAASRGTLCLLVRTLSAHTELMSSNSSKTHLLRTAQAPCLIHASVIALH